jgi:hypothetical protein
VFGLGNSASYDPSLLGAYPHLVPVEILCEEGAIGALLYLWMLAIVVRDSRFLLRRKGSLREERVSFSILIGIIVYMFLISLKQGSLLSTATFFMCVMLFSKAVAVTRERDRMRRKSQAISEKPTASGKLEAHTLQFRKYN